MKSHLATIGALLMTSACFGLAIQAWLHSEAERCQAIHDDLYAECFAPQGLAALIIGAIFALSTLALALLALRKFPKSGE